MNEGRRPRAFGASQVRSEDARLITGRGRFTDDLTLPRQCYAQFVRSPYAHAEIRAVDVSGALEQRGTLTVLTGADYAASGLGTLMCGWMIHSVDGEEMRAGVHPPLASERSRYVGDPVAVVVAETAEQARDAAERVVVDYVDLPVVTDVAAAQAEDAPQLHVEAPGNLAFDWDIGNADATRAALEQSDHVVHLTLTNNRLVPNALEPRAVNADYDPGRDQLTVHLTTQNPHGIRTTLAAVIGLQPEHKLRVISEDVGGGFGSKAFNYPEEVICCWASKRLGRPVKWTSDRSEAFLTDAHGRDHVTHVQLGLDSNYRFQALQVRTEANIGAYLSTFGSLIPTYVYAPLLSGQYVIPHIHAGVKALYTNTTPVDAYRGAGRPEASYVVERIVDRAARQLGVDPAELRRTNFIREFPYQTPLDLVYDIGDYQASLDEALTMIDYAGFAARRERSAQTGRLRGLGIANYVEAAGIGPSAQLAKLGAGAGLWESAQIRVNPTGTVEVLTGSHAHGQGHETTFAQLVADRFGIPFEDIDIVHGDTDKVQAGVGTFGSRSGPVGLSAVSIGCDRVIEKARRIAARLLDVDEQSVDFDDGVFSHQQTNRKFSFAEIAGAAHAAADFPTSEIEPGLKADCFFDPPNFTFPAGCHICEIEVDPDTGVVTIVDFVAVDDFGALVNPMIVEGQVHGGVAQGLGQAMLEHTVYDRDTGQLLSGSYMDYCMPRADDLPNIRVGFTMTKTTSNPLGIKGCGEAGAIGAPPAFINALTHALDIEHFDMPATPERVWRALQATAPTTHGGDS